MNRTLAGGAPGTSRREPRIAWAGLIPLFAVYLIWGSTYLAIRLTVREGAGFSPFTMGAMRTAAGGGLLLLGAACAHSRLRLTKEELFVLAASGIFLWTGGNGLVIWAEQRTASGYAALFVGLTPIWVAVIEAFLDRRLPSWLLAGSLLTGFAGLGVLSLPLLAAGTKADFFSILAL
ncbi:MAG: EamA family transporter, partial [Bacillota bacterium]